MGVPRAVAQPGLNVRPRALSLLRQVVLHLLQAALLRKKDRQILGLQRNGKALWQLQPELHGQDAADIGARIVITREHLLVADEGHIQPRGLDATGRQKPCKAMGAVQDLFHVAKLRALVKKHLHHEALRQIVIKLSYRRKDLSSVTFAAQKAVSLSLFRRFGQILYTVYIVYSLDSSFLLW